MPRIHQTRIWQLQIPDGWNVQGDGESAMFFRPDGVGMLMVLADDHAPSDLSFAAVERFAHESWPEGSAFAAVSCGSLRGVTGTRTERVTYWRGWWLPCRGRLVYASYQCAAANAAAEREEINEILQSINESQAA
jgi:hypothetical protein